MFLLKFKKQDIFACVLIAIALVSSFSFLSYGIGLSVSDAYSYIAYENERSARNANSDYLGYSFFAEEQSKPECDKFVMKTFGINVDNYSLNHVIHSYAQVGDSNAVLNHNTEIRAYFASDLDYFFGRKVLRVNDSINTDYSLIRINVSADLAMNMLGKNDEIFTNHDLNDIASLSFVITVNNIDYNCKIYGIIKSGSGFFEQQFGNKAVFLHDNEMLISNYQRIIITTSGRYRNKEIIKTFSENGYEFSSYKTYVFTRDEMQLINNYHNLNDFFKVKSTAYIYILSSVLFAVLLLFLLLIQKKSLIMIWTFSFVLIALMELTILIICKYTMIDSLFLFLRNSLFLFLTTSLSIIVVFLARKVVCFENKK